MLFCSFFLRWSPWPLLLPLLLLLLLLRLERLSIGGKRVGSYSAPSDFNTLQAIKRIILGVSVTMEGL